MRIWRALKALGCGSLRDGVYVLPATEAHEESLQDLADDMIGQGGTAWLLPLKVRSVAEDAAFRTLFDRSEAYAQLAAALAAARQTLSTLSSQEINRQVRRLRKDYEAVRSIDYFPNEASAHAELMWQDFVGTVDAALSPGEPHPREGAIRPLDRRDYQQRQWATRRNLWVDRMASAWLILRHIDRKAQFVWLDDPARCPKKALGFDFDGAAFTHLGSRVSFEVLAASFGLDTDPAIARIGAVVHALDVGGVPVVEAAGIEAVLAGARERCANDDKLLAEAGRVFDSLYAAYGKESDHD
jgi:hypothetical protein